MIALRMPISTMLKQWRFKWVIMSSFQSPFPLWKSDFHYNRHAIKGVVFLANDAPIFSGVFLATDGQVWSGHGIRREAQPVGAKTSQTIVIRWQMTPSIRRRCLRSRAVTKMMETQARKLAAFILSLVGHTHSTVTHFRACFRVVCIQLEETPCRGVTIVGRVSAWTVRVQRGLFVSCKVWWMCECLLNY